MIFVHALGTAQIDAGEARVTPASARRFALLLHLAAEKGRRVSRSTLHDLIFPDQNEKNARHSIRELLYQLRQTGVPVISDAHGIEFPDDSVRSDYDELIEGATLDEMRIRSAGGGFLPGYVPTHSEAFTEWYEAYRARSIFELCTVFLREVGRAKSAADWPATERAARACLAVDPLNETATLALAEMLAIAGSKAQAVRVLDDYSREVGRSDRLHLPAAALKRRIAERLPTTYNGHRETPFLGRANELGHLMARFDLARHGLAQCVSAIGEPGIGKTRLVGELAMLATLQGAQAHVARVQPQDVHRPLSAFIDLLPSLLDAPGSLGCSPPRLSLLNRLCSSKSLEEGPGSPTRPSEEALHENLSAITELVDSVSNEAPLVLAFDDIQWLDATSLSLIANLVSGRGRRRLLFALTSRPNDQLPILFRHSDQTSFLHLEALDGGSVSTIVTTRMSEFGIHDEEAARWICDASGGNPLFAVMLVSHFAETRTRFDAPPTLRSLLTARVRQLSEPAQALLALACLLARHCSLSRIASAAGIPHLHLMTALSELERAHLVRIGGVELRAPHALIVEATLANASDLSIAAAHRRIAELLEDESRAVAVPSSLWDAADHWIAGGETERGIHLLHQCAQNADDMGRPREAAELLLRTASLSRSSTRRSVLLKAMRAAAKSGEHDVVLRAGDLLRDDGWNPEHDELELAELTAMAVWRDDATAGEKLVACIESPSATEEHRHAAAHALLRFANSSRDPVQATKAWRILEPVVRNSSGPVVFRLTAAMLYHGCFGDFRQLPHFAAQAIAASRPLTPPAGAQLLFLAGLAFMRSGELEKAFSTWRHAYELAESSGLSRRQFEIAHTLRSFAADAGLDDEATEWTSRVESLSAVFPEFRQSISQLSFESDIAAAQEDLAGLRICHRRASALFGDKSTGRIVRWMHAIQMHIALLSRERLVPHEAIASLTEHHHAHFESGDASDIEVATALRIAVATNHPGTARAVLRRYLLEYRQNIAPLWSCLREAIRSADLTDEAVEILNGLKESSLSPEAMGTPTASVG